MPEVIFSSPWFRVHFWVVLALVRVVCMLPSCGVTLDEHMPRYLSTGEPGGGTQCQQGPWCSAEGMDLDLLWKTVVATLMGLIRKRSKG